MTAPAIGIVFAPPAMAAPAEKQDARKHYDQATSAFGLGRYADAAAEYEAAFRLRPEPALLYNCAQSYRLAGNKQRAMELYRNYVRLYGNAPNADDARKHVADLELEMAHPPTAAAPPPASPASPAVTPLPRTVATTPSPAVPPATPTTTSTPPTAPPTLQPSAAITAAATPTRDVHVDVPPMGASDTPATAPPLTDTESRSLVGRPWFWAAIGAAVVGGTVAVILASSGEKDPKASLGVVPAN